MIQLAYTSSAAESLGSGDVFKIIETSARNNANAQLTGFLIYANSQFFQLIEGPPSAMDDLLRRLKHDPRHHSIEVVHRANVAIRSFPNWSMKRIALPDGVAELHELIPQLGTAPTLVRAAAEKFANRAFGCAS